jgi:hypothetical protein
MLLSIFEVKSNSSEMQWIRSRHCDGDSPVFAEEVAVGDAAFVRALIDVLKIPSQSLAVARGLAGHIVGGVASQEEVEAFWKFCRSDG